MANPVTTVCIECKAEEESRVRRAAAPNPAGRRDDRRTVPDREGR
ncbi:MAG: hypothetical protein HPY67_03680 [Syntrophaceae bacterium]|nr:hypothetical protein [Syntrophaceae bacterium]